MRLIAWLLRAFIFFTLFAFALNNQQTATVNWFFGVNWRAPMVIVVLVAFAAGCVLGTLSMLPGWWRRRQGGAGLVKRWRGEPVDGAAATSPAGVSAAGGAVGGATGGAVGGAVGSSPHTAIAKATAVDGV